MLIIGCDLHTRYQEIAMLDTATGEQAQTSVFGLRLVHDESRKSRGPPQPVRATRSDVRKENT